MEPHAWESLTKRLDSWEREKRHLLAVGLVVVLASAGLMTHASHLGRRPKVLEAEQFVVRDASGQIRAQLALQKDGTPQLSLYDSQGRDQLVLRGLNDDAATIYLCERGEVRATMSAMSNGSSSVSLIDKDRGTTTGMYVGPDKTTGLTLRNDKSEVQLRVAGDGQAGVRVVDSAGKEAGRLGTEAPPAKPEPSEPPKLASRAEAPSPPARSSAAPGSAFSKSPRLQHVQTALPD
jgi:hypothetical protein